MYKVLLGIPMKAKKEYNQEVNGLQIKIFRTKDTWKSVYRNSKHKKSKLLMPH